MAVPLKGIRIIEFAGIGPGPFCGMMLADHGAEVIRIDRPGGFVDPRDPLSRNRTSIALDMKNPAAVQIARELCKSADGIIEGYRRSEEHTSELQSLMRISYAVFCLKKKKTHIQKPHYDRREHKLTLPKT